jgi:hypothetical protein
MACETKAPACSPTRAEPKGRKLAPSRVRRVIHMALASTARTHRNIRWLAIQKMQRMKKLRSQATNFGISWPSACRRSAGVSPAACSGTFSSRTRRVIAIA